MSLQDIETLMPQELINYKPVSAVIKEFFGSSQLSPVHGPDEPAVRDHAQAAALARSGPAASRASAPASRCATCTRRTTVASARSRRRKVRTSASSRRSRPTRASTTSASSRRRTARCEDGRVTDEVVLPLGARGGGATHRAGERARRRAEAHSRRAGLGPHRRRVHDGAAGRGRVHGRVAEPARVGGGVADPVPRERRREPRAHGLEHAAPGACRCCAPTRRSSAPAWRRVVARDSGVTVVAKRDGVVEQRRRDAHRRQGRRADDGDGDPASTSTT